MIVTAGSLRSADVGRRIKFRQWTRLHRLGWSPHWYRLNSVTQVDRPGAAAGPATTLSFYHDRQPEAVLTTTCLASDLVKLR